MQTDNYPKGYLYRRIVEAKIFIDVHYALPIDLNNISEEAYFSKFHFIRLFKSAYGVTPHQYLIKVRIENAKLLLAKENPVSQVCFTIGFESISSFTALFKKLTGITPSAYQKMKMRKYEIIQDDPLHFVPACFASIAAKI